MLPQKLTPRLERLVSSGGKLPFTVAESRAALRAAEDDVEKAEAILLAARNAARMNKDLYDAAYRGDMIASKYLISRGADASWRHPTGGASPLYVACECGHLELAKLLLQAGAKADQPRDDGATPLYMACREANTTVVLALLAAGAKADTVQCASTPGPF